MKICDVCGESEQEHDDEQFPCKPKKPNKDEVRRKEIAKQELAGSIGVALFVAFLIIFAPIAFNGIIRWWSYWLKDLP